MSLWAHPVSPGSDLPSSVSSRPPLADVPVVVVVVGRLPLCRARVFVAARCALIAVVGVVQGFVVTSVVVVQAVAE